MSKPQNKEEFKDMNAGLVNKCRGAIKAKGVYVIKKSSDGRVYFMTDEGWILLPKDPTKGAYLTYKSRTFYMRRHRLYKLKGNLEQIRFCDPPANVGDHIVIGGQVVVAIGVFLAVCAAIIVSFGRASADPVKAASFAMLGSTTPPPGSGEQPETLRHSDLH